MKAVYALLIAPEYMILKGFDFVSCPLFLSPLCPKVLSDLKKCPAYFT